MSKFGVEEVRLRALDVGDDDVISQAEAARLLAVSHQSVLERVNSRRFAVVWRLRDGRRMLLRREVEEFAAGDRRSGGATERYAVVVGGEDSDDLEGVEYAVEDVVICAAAEIAGEDVVSQLEASRMLGIRRNAMGRRLDRGVYTIVWDLERDGSGYGSARMLLRAEVVEGGEGGRFRASRQRRPPGL